MSVTILIGDAMDRLRDLPSDSVDCCITSPPYWGLRDYDCEGQIGMEPTLGEHLAVMVEIFEEVRRVLKPTGSLWLNYGDCYATAPNGRSAADTKAAGDDDRTFRDKPFSTVGPIQRAPSDVTKTLGTRDGSGRRGGGNNPAGPIIQHQPGSVDREGQSGNKGNGGAATGQRVVAGGYLKPKDLCMLPNRLAIALQDAGWWVRSEIIWGKPNAMPDSSGTRRPSTAHEKIFLLTKSGDADVWRAVDTGEISFSPDLSERCPLVTQPERMGPRWTRLGSYYDAAAVRLPSAGDEVSNGYPGSDGDGVRKRTTTGNTRTKFPDSWDTGEGGHGSIHRNGREKGQVRTGNGPRPGNLDPRRVGHINHTGIQHTPRGEGRLLRNFEQGDALAELIPPDIMAWEIAIAGFSGAHFATFPPALVVPCVLAGCPAGGTVLDPFGGAGTTGMVADRLGRDAILIELNHGYAEIARDRLRAALCRVEIDGGRASPHSAGPLFDTEAA